MVFPVVPHPDKNWLVPNVEIKRSLYLQAPFFCLHLLVFVSL
jgi:hypothetical protein